MDKLHSILPLLVVSIIVISCENVDPFDIDNVDFGDPEIGVPLVNSTFFIGDLGANPDNNTEVISDAEGRVTLRYSDNIPPVSITEVFPPVDNSVAITTNPQNFGVPFYDIVIQNGDFKASSLAFEITNPENEGLIVTISISGLVDHNNDSFSRSFILQANERFVSDDIDLSDWSIETPQSGTLELTYFAFLNGTTVDIPDLTLNFKRLEFSYVDGLFNNAALPTTEDLIDIAFFDSWVSGGLNLADPRLVFEVNNSMGIPAELRLNFANITNIQGETFELVYDQLNQGIAFNYPQINQVGESVSTTVEINGSNSNAVDLFNLKPSMIDYDLDLFINPQGNIPGFYTDESEIAVDAIIELPLNMRANDLILQDTIGFNEIEFDDIEGTGELKLSLINAFPIGVGINLDFLDAQGETLFSLVPQDEWVSVSANTDARLAVEDLEAQISCIPILEEDVLKIPLVSNVLTRVLITTTEDFQDDFVWVLDHHGVDIKLGAILR